MNPRKYAGPVILSMTPEQEAEAERERSAQRDALDRWHLVAIDGWLAAYQAGCVPLKTLLEGVRASVDVLPDGIGRAVQGGRERLLGHVVMAALDGPAPPSKPKGGRPPWPAKFKEAARGLVALIAEHEGLVVNRDPADGSVSAFERAAEYYRLAGIRGVKAETVRDWYGKT